MPNIDSLIQTISQTLSTAPHETAFFTTLGLQYAYSQLNLHNDTALHCNFNIVSGDMTGTYCFKTGFYGLTDMPAEFQKAKVDKIVPSQKWIKFSVFYTIY